jgi:hypothetical protein
MRQILASTNSCGQPGLPDDPEFRSAFVGYIE